MPSVVSCRESGEAMTWLKGEYEKHPAEKGDKTVKRCSKCGRMRINVHMEAGPLNVKVGGTDAPALMHVRAYHCKGQCPPPPRYFDGVKSPAEARAVPPYLSDVEPLLERRGLKKDVVTVSKRQWAKIKKDVARIDASITALKAQLLRGKKNAKK